MDVIAAPSYASVQRSFPGETVVCLGTGPSLTQADVDACRGRARVIAIKDAVQWAPWADVLYCAGGDRAQWWPRNGPSLHGFQGQRYTVDPNAAEWASVLRNTGFGGLEADPTGVKIGKHSGYQAINVAFHLGATRIVLLGYDMQTAADGRDHFFGPHWHGRPSNVHGFRDLFDTILEPLAAAGVELLNASRQTALTSVRRVTLDEALS